jgi:putative glutamine amidotransferase
VRPVVGITTYAQEASWSYWKQPAALIPLDYVDAVQRAGGRPVLIPPDDDGIEEVLDALDGLIFSGGNDLTAESYGAEAAPETTGTNPERDSGELALLSAALERDLPVLAICRGVEVLNVARGGDLVQHIPETLGHEDHREVPGTFSEHAVDVKEGSRLASIVGPSPAVTSHHHQAVGRLGDGLVETAWAKDGTIEGAEDPTRRFAVGVQWHPEAGQDDALFANLVDEARRYRSEQGR